MNRTLLMGSAATVATATLIVACGSSSSDNDTTEVTTGSVIQNATIVPFEADAGCNEA